MSSEKGAPIGAEEAVRGGHGVTLLLEGPKIIPDQPLAIEEQPMTIADSGMRMGHLPVAEEAPLKDSLLSADRVKSAQEFVKIPEIPIADYDNAKFLELEKLRAEQAQENQLLILFSLC